MQKKRGLYVVVSDDFRYLLRIENTYKKANLTPWLRRKDTATLEIPHRLKKNTPVPIDIHHMRNFITCARKGLAGDGVEVRIHAHLRRFIVHASHQGAIAVRVVETLGELKALLTRFKLKYQNIRVALIDRDFTNIVAIFRFRLGLSLFFELERLFDLRLPRVRTIREVLVLTNLAHGGIDALQTNLPFWSKGILGFRFRHVYGNLDKRRVEEMITQKQWDLLLYRGHAVVEKGCIHWRLADGNFKVPELNTLLYFHLSCLPNPEKLRLDKIPATQLLTTLAVVEDFDDALLVDNFLTRYKLSMNIRSAMRSLQQEYPQFVYFSLSA
ncbi:MAG TPA: hypothetical protein PLY93_02735 [Turneriella sp.]|nr:hypothetical protein [Turneriella sp.]